MIISDANPVQFWAINKETFNEKEVDGIFPKCFCAPWNCSDEITNQFKDDPGLDLILFLRNSDNDIIFETEVPEIEPGIYQLTFVPENEGICNDEVHTLLAIEGDIQRLLAPSAWTDIVSTFDSKTATQFVEALTSTDGGISSRMPLVLPVGAIITITYTVQVSGTWTAGGPIPIFFTFVLMDGLGNAASTGLLTVPEKTISANGTYVLTEVLTVTDTTAFLQVNLLEDIASGTANINITIPAGQILYISNDDLIAKSDCLSIKSDHDETVLIEYSSNRNFAGLNYSDVSPDPAFFIRVPAIFFRGRFPQEKEVIELSNSRSIQLNAQVKAQKQLQVKNMPDYMHRKLLLVLSHQFVTIDGQDWVLSEEYELIPPANPRWPQQKAQCWLTEKDYIMRSIL